MATNMPQGRPAAPTRPDLQGTESERASQIGQPINPGEDQMAPPRPTSRNPTNDISRAEEQRGTRRVWMWGVAVIAVIFVALLAMSFFATTT